MFTNARVCLFDVILIVMKWILVQVLCINFAGTNFAYLPILSKVFRFTFLCFVCSVCLFTNVQLYGSAKVKKVEVSLVSAKVKPYKGLSYLFHANSTDFSQVSSA